MTELFMFSAIMAVLLFGTAIGVVILAKWFGIGDDDAK